MEKDKYTKHPYNDCSVPDCYTPAVWLPVVLLYDPAHGNKARKHKPAQVTIKGCPLCNRHVQLGRIGLDHLISPKAWDDICAMVVSSGGTKPEKNFTGIGFIRKDEANTEAEAQWLDPRKLS